MQWSEATSQGLRITFVLLCQGQLAGL
jgi:hypothetical protein